MPPATDENTKEVLGRFGAVEGWIGHVELSSRADLKLGATGGPVHVDERVSYDFALQKSSVTNGSLTWEGPVTAATAKIDDKVISTGFVALMMGQKSVSQTSKGSKVVDPELLRAALEINAETGTWDLSVTPVEVQVTSDQPVMMSIDRETGQFTPGKMERIKETVSAPALDNVATVAPQKPKKLPRSGTALELKIKGKGWVSGLAALAGPVAVNGGVSLSAAKKSKLKAVPIAKPSRCERGQVVTLDGSKSTGAPESYRWTFKSLDPAIELNAAAVRTDQVTHITVLGLVEATLEVGKANETPHRERVRVQVKSGGLGKVSFEHHPRAETKNRKAEEPRMLTAGMSLPVAVHWGTNVCAIEVVEKSAQESDCYLHHHATAEQGTKWNDVAYVTDVVLDPGGPFDGMFYVKQQSLKLHRWALVNRQLFPTTKRGEYPTVYDESMTRQAIQEPKGVRQYKITEIVASILAHERYHSLHMKEVFDKRNPIPKLEKLFGETQEDLVKKCDALLEEVEQDICEALDPTKKECHDYVYKKMIKDKWDKKSSWIYLPQTSPSNDANRHMPWEDREINLMKKPGAE